MKLSHWFLVLFLLTIPVILAGCKGNESKSPAQKDYPIKGKVVAVNPDKPSVKLDHEDIPGLMNAMEMEFRVENANLLEGIKVGDQVQGQLRKGESGPVITRLDKR
jgi:Cu/Ag efflux protein CusF